MSAAAAAAAALFFVLWWMLQAEESPWVPAGLAASVVMLVAAFARILVARRVRNRYRNFAKDTHSYPTHRHASLTQVMHSTSRHAETLRALQKQSLAADERDSPEAHRELYQLCGEYLNGAERAMQSTMLQADGRVALRAGQERVRELQKHHLLTWARSSAQSLTHEAQQRVRLYEKVETANRALDCIDQALKVYPDNLELRTSAQAVREFITSSRVAHWVELAERAAFKGYFQRAIDCYRDALYYLSKDKPDSAGQAAAERIIKEIEMLRARLTIKNEVETVQPGDLPRKSQSDSDCR